MAQCPGGMSFKLHVLFLVMVDISSCIAFSQHGFLSASAKVFGSSALMACSSTTSSLSSRTASPGGSPPPSRSSSFSTWRPDHHCDRHPVSNPQYVVLRTPLVGCSRSCGWGWRRRARCNCWRQWRFLMQRSSFSRLERYSTMNWFRFRSCRSTIRKCSLVTRGCI